MPTVPLVQIDDDDGLGGVLFTLEVLVDGASQRLLLDTGAARTAIDGRQIRRAVRTIGSDSRAAFAGRNEVRMVEVEISVGGLGQELSVSVAAPGEPVLLGIDVLGGLRLTYRPAVPELSLGQDAAHVGRPEPLTVGARGHHHVPLEWDGASALAVWDSGASINLVDQAFVREHPQLFTDVDASDGTDATGTQARTQTVRMCGPRIAGVSFDESLAAVIDLSFLPSEPKAQFIVGHPIIRQAEWTFDGPQRRWSLRRG